MSELFGGVLERGGVAEAVSDRAWLQAMLDFEAALARATQPADVAGAIAAACRAERFDAEELGVAAMPTGNPAAPLVRALADAVGGPAGARVHRGATSQDVIDTAAMLVAKRAREPLLADLRGAADAAAGLAAAHRDTPMAGRTLLQQAVPTTFGLKAAGWMVALDASCERLAGVELAVQLGGAAGTLAALDDGIAAIAKLATELDLAEPVLPWHTDRTRIAALAGALAAACGAVGKVARDLALLAQTEVGEAADGAPGRGGSSAMPHKRNPVAAVAAAACAAQAPGLQAILGAAMAHEHERAAGAWHAEWAPLRELLVATGSAAAWLRDALENLRVDPARMRENLGLTGGLLLAERVAAALDVPNARELVEEAAADERPFAEALAARPEIAERLGDRLDELLDPATYLGSAPALVDRALARRAR
jgi:3-carboxy-cis,cis-muconate cycloisomerase